VQKQNDPKSTVDRGNTRDAMKWDIPGVGTFTHLTGDGFGLNGKWVKEQNLEVNAVNVEPSFGASLKELGANVRTAQRAISWAAWKLGNYP
jgi:hypothetical protein